MFGPGAERPDEEGNGTLLNSSSVLIPPAQFRANRFQLSASASRATISSGGAQSSTLSREAGKRTDSDIVLSSHSDPLRIPCGSPRTQADRISVSWSPEGLSVARYRGLQPTLMARTPS